MKPWFTLTIVCWTLVCLPLSLSQQASLNHPLQVAGSSQWLDRCREPALDSPAASVVGSTEFDPVRAGPLTSLVLDSAWTAGNIGPPSQENHGPPELIAESAGWRSKLAAQSHIEPPCSRKFLTQPTEFEESGFCNSGFATAFS
jgi:hypothetical protein